MGLVRGVAAAVAGLVLVAGCADDPEPKFAPEASDSSKPSAPVSPSVSPGPIETAAALTPEQTVRAWIRARNEALQSGDTSGMAELSADQCRGCSNMIDPIEEVFADGGSYSTPGWTLDKGKVTKRSGDRATFSAAITMSGGTTRASADAEPVDYEASKHIMEFQLRREDGLWRISLIGFIS